MKKSVRLIAVTLVCVLLMSLVTVAHADSCYEMIKLLYQLETEDALVCLGEGIIFDANEADSENVYFIVSVPDTYVGVTGLNADGQPEGYTWLDVEDMDSLLAFVQFCVGYETLSSCLDECKQLIGGIYLVAGEDPVLVTDAESAQNFLDTFSQVLEEDD